jgi:hypothetical protein
VRRAQPDDGARHAGLRPGPLIYDPRRETPQAPRPCTNAGEYRLASAGEAALRRWPDRVPSLTTGGVTQVAA